MYSAADYVEMLLIYGECERNARAAAGMYAQRFPNRNHPNHKVILSATARTIEIGHILPNRKESSGAPRTVRTVENEEAILDAFEEGTESIREVAQELYISKTSVHRVMKTLTCQIGILYNREENTPNFVSRILFSDESTFGKEGCFNAYNWHIRGPILEITGKYSFENIFP
jgi:hypothetical protein